jgi:hypothetical protein
MKKLIELIYKINSKFKHKVSEKKLKIIGDLKNREIKSCTFNRKFWKKFFRINLNNTINIILSKKIIYLFCFIILVYSKASYAFDLSTYEEVNKKVGYFKYQFFLKYHCLNTNKKFDQLFLVFKFNMSAFNTVLKSAEAYQYSKIKSTKYYLNAFSATCSGFNCFLQGIYNLSNHGSSLPQSWRHSFLVKRYTLFSNVLSASSFITNRILDLYK